MSRITLVLKNSGPKLNKQINIDIERNKVKELLKNTELDKHLIDSVEESIFNYIKTEQYKYVSDNFNYKYIIKIYIHMAIHIINNLDSKNHIGNNYLANAINNGEIDVNKLPYMTPQELFPQFWDEYCKNLQHKLYLITKPLEANSNIYTCSKCKNNNTYTTTKQLRSSDEGMTTIIKCCTPNCGKIWRL